MKEIFKISFSPQELICIKKYCFQSGGPHFICGFATTDYKAAGVACQARDLPSSKLNDEPLHCRQDLSCGSFSWESTHELFPSWKAFVSSSASSTQVSVFLGQLLMNSSALQRGDLQSHSCNRSPKQGAFSTHRWTGQTRDETVSWVGVFFHLYKKHFQQNSLTWTLRTYKSIVLKSLNRSFKNPQKQKPVQLC